MYDSPATSQVSLWLPPGTTQRSLVALPQAECSLIVCSVGTKVSIDPEMKRIGNVINLTLVKLSKLTLSICALIFGMSFNTGNNASAISEIPVKVFSMIAPLNKPSYYFCESRETATAPPKDLPIR